MDKIQKMDDAGGQKEDGRQERKLKVQILEPEETEIKVRIDDKTEARISTPKDVQTNNEKVGKSGKVKLDEKKAKKKTAKSTKTVKTTKATKKATANKSKKNKTQTNKKAKVELKKKGRKRRERKRKGLFILITFSIILAIIIAATISLINFFSKGPREDVKIDFSKATGLYENEIEIELNAEETVLSPIVNIKYTLNGDNPVTAGQVYNGPIKLALNENVAVYPVKAAYCYFNNLCSKIYTETYILSRNPEKEITLDVISITSEHKNLYDYETGIMVPGKTYDDNVASGMDPEKDYVPGNYNNREDEWIREAEVVRLTPEGEVAWNQNVGLQISGGTSAASEVKSFKLVANKKYGYNKLAYSFDDSGTTSIGLAIPKKYNSLRLRVGGQDAGSGNIRAAVASRLAEESGFDGYSATKRAVVYLNGEFYAIVDVEQNFSDSFLEKRFSLPDSDNVEKIKGTEEHVLDEAGIIKLFETDLNITSNREKLEQKVDMDDYLKYYAIELLLNNTDWPQNSYEIWRYAGGEVANNKYTDGRWRFLIYDTDMVYLKQGNLEYFPGIIGDQFEAIMESKNKAQNSTFRSVINSTYYRQKFLAIMRELLGTSFKLSNILEVMEVEQRKIAPAMKLYYSEQDYKEWKRWIELMKEAVSEQDSRIREDLYKYFKVRV
ncbi:CotH kinase family protein [Candidatus Saccharibacteria bacterium]|nr:CotH kinase family protein [Candidatus Saccharibacteria bacterium]